MFGKSVSDVRTNLGRQLARETGVPADVVVPIPDSGVCAAIGYAEEAGMPMRFGLIRNHYVGRTFIEPAQSIRHFGVKVKLNPVRSLLNGQRVVLIDDSIVRGTTSRKIVKMVRAAGAAEVHVRISCPPTISPCFYGVDTPQRSELIAATHSLEEIRKYLEADSVAYLSLEGLLTAVAPDGGRYCTSCYTGRYPVAFPRDQQAYLQLALKLDSTHRALARGRAGGMSGTELQGRRRRHRRRQRDGSPHQVDRARARSRPACCRRSDRSAACSRSAPAAGPTRCSCRAPTASAPS